MHSEAHRNIAQALLEKAVGPDRSTPEASALVKLAQVQALLAIAAAIKEHI